MPLTILDLGAGTGRFASLLATFPRAHVVAVEPSRGMLAEAKRRTCGGNVEYLAGSGERIPLRDHSCHLVWLSQVFHHLPDRPLCASELRRVVQVSGRVLVRGTFGNRLEGFPTLFRFFPGARRICEDLPTADEAIAVFEAQGFALVADQQVQQRTCGTLGEFAERSRKRADTSLALISDQEFEQGLVALERAAREESQPTPVLETLDLLVFQRAR
jgi:SAM-dependent methyltransferase